MLLSLDAAVSNKVNRRRDRNWFSACFAELGERCFTRNFLKPSPTPNFGSIPKA